jgi:hypothetical protein
LYTFQFSDNALRQTLEAWQIYPHLAWPGLSPISACRAAPCIGNIDSSTASPSAAATSSYPTALHVPHATRAVRLPSFHSTAHSGALAREIHPNIAMHHALSSRRRQQPDLRTDSRRTMISHLNNSILPGLLWLARHLLVTEITHVCNKDRHTPAASRTSYEATRVQIQDCQDFILTPSPSQGPVLRVGHG